jgi:A/G-specific adenine glycosylase
MIASEIQHRFGGVIPESLDDLKLLYGKGFGNYMAHALLCFSFGKDVAVVDANVERILKRVFSLKIRKNGHRDRKLWTFAAQLIPSGRGREYNWALIDFGAMVCTPYSPKCSSCPILKVCDFGIRRVPKLA